MSRRKVEVISDVSTIGKTFLSFEAMTHKKLQKLCYYAYSILLTNTKGRQKLFNDRIEAWIHGPVMPALFGEYRNYSVNQVISKEISPIEEDSSLYSYLKMIYNVFGKYSGNDLEEMTHRGIPWKNAREGLGTYEYSSNKIKDKDIIEHFNQYSEN